jgi:type III pantothenate kinase
MIIAADVRNGGVSVGLVSAEGQWQAIVWLSAVDRSADEWAFLIRALFAERGMGLQDLSQAVLSSVVPAWTGIFVDVLEGFLPRGASCLVVGPGIKTGLRIRTDNPAEVGSDLVCNAVAASALVPVPCIIIDFSTTLSFTALDRQGDLVVWRWPPVWKRPPRTSGSGPPRYPGKARSSRACPGEKYR